MYDMHYDLLTILYINFMKKNRLSDLPRLLELTEKVYNNSNISGGIISLYFNSVEEMKSILDINYSELTDIKKMFKTSISFLEDLKEIELIPKSTEFAYEIEGCDYLKIEDLSDLYKLGLRIISPICDGCNVYVASINGNIRLTNNGVDLIKEAVKEGIAIDLTHTSKQTFNDILDVVESEDKSSTIITRNIGNIDNQELERLNKLNGYLSIDINKDLLINLKNIIENIKFDESRLMLSSNNKSFLQKSTHTLGNLNQEMRKTLASDYDRKFIDNILENNPRRLIKSLN